MKKMKKTISFVLSMVMVLTMLPVVGVLFTPKSQAYGTYSKNYSTEYYYASGTTFISGLCVGYDKSFNTVKSQISEAGWTNIDNTMDMMAGWGSSKQPYCFGVGYKTTNDPTQAITGIRWYDSDDGHAGYYLEGGQNNWPGALNGICNGIQYYRVGASPLLAYRDGIVDLFRDMGSNYGYEYLCATTDRSAGPAITSVKCFSSVDNNWNGAGCIEGCCTWHDASHKTPRYVGYKCITTTVNSNTLRSNYTTALGRYNENNYSDKYTSASRTALQNALAAAETILADLNDGYTTSNQDTINTAAAALSNAVSGLTLNTYTVTFKGYTGGTTVGTLKTQSVSYGNDATSPSVPTTYDANNHYTFSSWSGTFTNVTSARTITANYTTTAHSLTGWSNDVGGASGTHKRSCSCGYVQTQAHNFSSSVTTAATCTSAGVRTYTCSECSDQYTESIAVDPSAHNYGSWTMLNDTQHQRVCSYNAAHKEQQDHSWNSGTVSTPASCTSTGVITYTCTVCQGTKDETIPASAHDYTSQTPTDTYLKSAADCTHAAVYYYKCANCSAKGDNTYSYGSSLGHEFTVYVEEAASATCLANATERYKCSRCEETTVQDVAGSKLDHSYTGEIKNNNNGTHSYKCVNGCNGYGGTVSCACNTVVTPATCTTDGFTTHTCPDCGYVYTSDLITQFGHAWSSWAKVDDTYHRRICSNDASHIETVIHNWNSGEVISSPTSSETGLKVYTCSDCGAVKQETIPQTAGDAVPSGDLLGRFFSTSDVWWDAVNNEQNVNWQVGDYPSYNADLGMTYFNGMYVKVGRENMLSGVTRDTGLTISFNYRPNFTGMHRHIVSIGQTAYGSGTANHLFVSGGTCHNSSNCFPIVKWVNGNGNELINAYPAGLNPVQGYEYNIVVSIDKDEGVVFYIDGIKSETVYVGSDLNGQIGNIRSFLDEVSGYTYNYVGCSRWVSDAKLEGYLSDLRFYGKSMTDMQAYNLVKDMMGSSFDLAKPSFNAVAYHYNDEATGGFGNLVYTSGADTTRITGNDNDVEIKGTRFKSFTPETVVMVNDGVNAAYFPVQLETRRKDGTVWSNHIRYVASNNADFILRQNWIQTLDNNYSNGWTHWAGSHSNFGPRYISHQTSWESDNDDKNDTSRFAWSALQFDGQFDNENFRKYYNYVEFQAKAYCTWTGAKDNEKTGTGTFKTNESSNFYVLNYAPVYGKIETVSANYASYSADDWTYTESSYANYLTYVRRVMLCNPNRYAYQTRGVDAATAMCAAAIKQVANLDPVPVKKTATVKFVTEEGSTVKTIGNVVFNTQVANNDKPAGPAKAYDDAFHYDFTAWDSIVWDGYHDAESGIIISLDPNYNPVCHTYEGADPTYSAPGIGTCVCSRTDTVCALKDLINLDDVALEDVSGTSGKIALAPTKASDISFEIVGLKSSGDHTLYKSTNVPDTVQSLKLEGARVYTVSNDTSKIAYKFTKMDFSELQSFYALVKVTGTGNHKYGTNEIYTWQKITLVPEKNVMFDDTVEAIAYSNSANAANGYGIWSRITDSGSTLADATDSFGDIETVQSSTVNSVKYSFGDAHKVSVSNNLEKAWPTAQFTFTGSGFDVISVTDSNSGVFGVRVYNAVTGQQVKSRVVDTYYGYTYTQLFYNVQTRKIVDSGDENGTVLYAALPATPEESRVYAGIGTISYTMDQQYAVKENGNPVIAYGWLLSASSDVLYQVPCISMDLGDVGKYTVVIQPMFTEAFGHYNESGDVKYYNFIFDGIRIYNPADGSNEALALYAENGETYTRYEFVREAIKDADLVLIDGQDQISKENIAGYLAGAPKNELYLMNEGTAAFDVTFTNLTDARIGLRAVNGTPCTVTIGNGSATPLEITVGSATEQYYSLKALLSSGTTTTITVTNNGEGILSLTRLMTVTNTAPSSPSGAPGRYLTVGPQTAEIALATARMLNADLAIDESTIETASTADGTVTLTLTTGADAETVVIRDAEGNVIDPESITFTLDETGVKNWTVVFTAESEGEITCTLQAEYENGYAPDEPVKVTVTVDFPENELTGAEDDENHVGLDLRRIQRIIRKIMELIEMIISIFR